MAEPLRHRQTKEAATDMFSLQPPRHIPTLPSVMNYASDLVTGAHGDRRFGDDHGEAVNRRRNLSGGCIHV
jgi:hypothetical protein